jgi:hypothetical protein
MIGPISPDVKQMGARSAGNPHAACDVEGAGNVARSGCLGQLARQSSTLPRGPFFIPSPTIRFLERAEWGQGTETLAKLGALPPSGACVLQRLDA